MVFKVGIVGAPRSGKSVFSAQLFSEIQLLGLNGSKLISEYALEHLGNGGKIEILQDQIGITIKQLELEIAAEKAHFDPIICDSAAWIGAIYASDLAMNDIYDIEKIHPHDNPQKKILIENTLNQFTRYVGDMEKIKYDMVIYVPLFDNKDGNNKFRLHNYEDSKRVDNKIKSYLDKLVPNYVTIPQKLNKRSKFAKQLAKEIVSKTKC